MPAAPGADPAGGGPRTGAGVDDQAEPTSPDEARGQVHLPDEARARVLALAADRLGRLEPADVPAGLRPFARFAPSRRARLAAAPLAAAVDSDAEFREGIARELREALPELTAALERGHVPPATPPQDVAAVAYLLRPQGWTALVAAAGAALASIAAGAADSAAAAVADRLREQLDATRAAGRAEADRLRTELRGARSEADDLRRRVRDAGEQLRRSERAVAAASASAAGERAAAAAAASAAEAELRRQRARASAAEEAGEATRRAAREGRSVDGLRLRLLLDTVVEAATGLRRELALPATTLRPADLVAGPAEPGREPVGGVAVRGLAADDPALIDQLLALPQVHLIVDGYNVTKLGYGLLALESQRHRLVTGLAALAARTRAEVTVVFDGQERPTPLAVAAPRNVRVMFSAPGETADEVIRRLARAEPPGRPVVVVSSDREVADGVRSSGARPVPSAALVGRLERG